MSLKRRRDNKMNEIEKENLFFGIAFSVILVILIVIIIATIF